MRRFGRWLRIAGADPALIPRIVRRKVACGRGLGDRPVKGRIGSIDFEFDPALGEMANAMYCGLYEIRVVDAMRRLLRPGDVFLDVGANVGYHSAVAADLVGPSGAVYALEPVRSYYERLEGMARMNPGHRIVAQQVAAGERAGEASIAIAGYSNAGWNTLVPEHMPPSRRTRTELVPVVRLCDLLGHLNVNEISLIKIDVEGFELPVLRGLLPFMRSTPMPPPIICEIAPRAYPLLGTSLEALRAELTDLGYGAFDLRRPRRHVGLESLDTIRDVLLLPGRAHGAPSRLEHTTTGPRR